VRQEVERIFRREHRSHLVVLFGRGDASEFDLTGHRWRIIPTRCELDLRERLPRPEDKSPAKNVYLVDWAVDILPLDVTCRLAGGRLYHVARDARLAALFGARQVESKLAGSALAKVYLSGALPQPAKIQGLQLTHRAAWTSLLQAKFRLPEAALASVGALLAWAAGNELGPSFVRQADEDDLWRAVRRDLGIWIRESAGEAAGVVWKVWELGSAPRLLEILPLLAAARESGDVFLEGQLAGQLSAWIPGLASEVRRVESALTDPTTLEAAFPSESKALLAMLGRSQALAQSAGLGGLTLSSPRLPGGHEAREGALAIAVAAFVANPTADGATAVATAHADLEAHILDTHQRDETHRESRLNLVRLALWLARRQVSAPAGTAWQPAVDLARLYAEEGGYVEWARQQLRGLRNADQRLLAAARSLEALASQKQQDDHKSFAIAYVKWVDAGKPSAAAVPIESLSKQVIAPFLKGGDRRRLLVILMDGMSQAAAVQVLTRLKRVRRWGPIAWRPAGWHGVLPLAPVLAVAPTLTEVSRGAFFAGKADSRFGNESTDKDPTRWKANHAIREWVGEDAPPLFVRRDILSGHDLSKDIRDAIEGDCRAVAVVVNAIDEDLSSSVQVAKDYSLSPVLPLEALLTAAEGGERVVLLVADHGHILGDGTRSLGGRMNNQRPGGARWRALKDGETPEAEEVLLPKNAWVPSGWDRIAVLWDPNVVNRSAKYGEHGGLSLAEAVSPAVLIAPDYFENAFPNDSDLSVRPWPMPDWWTMRARAPQAKVQPLPPVKLDRPVQASLFASKLPPPPQPQPVEASEPRLVAALRSSSIFQGRISDLATAGVERVLSWVTILAQAGDSASAADFAALAGVKLHQVAGIVTHMSVLNADGFSMVEFDHTSRRVVLHRSRLMQHYGIKL